ncbi:uncharacterized protein LOC134092671 [Sardina pilchardus]|uniref:uncharacterized protein LOC134092671 n=1 Tax=Sardina pilchardus TaxID=27697 RepID=UPI002E1158DD
MKYKKFAQCNGAPCSFNATLGECQCDCNEDLTYGSSCQYGFNETNVKLGSIIADGVAQYRYHNNESQINFLNEQLGSKLENLTDLRPYISCNIDFSHYLAEISQGRWLCVGFCLSDPDYCNQHGECLNEKSGPVCQCYESFLKSYHGPQCDLFHWGAGFYAILFGCLSAGLLLLIIIVIVIVDILEICWFDFQEDKLECTVWKTMCLCQMKSALEHFGRA